MTSLIDVLPVCIAHSTTAVRSIRFWLSLYPTLASFPQEIIFAPLALIITRLSQSLWTRTPKNFYHPSQLSIRCVVQSFNSWSTVPLGVVVQMRWLNLTNRAGSWVFHDEPCALEHMIAVEIIMLVLHWKMDNLTTWCSVVAMFSRRIWCFPPHLSCFPWLFSYSIQFSFDNCSIQSVVGGT